MLTLYFYAHEMKFKHGTFLIKLMTRTPGLFPALEWIKKRHLLYIVWFFFVKVTQRVCCLSQSCGFIVGDKNWLHHQVGTQNIPERKIPTRVRVRKNDSSNAVESCGVF